MIDVPVVSDPLPGPDGNMVDITNTGEKWITDKDIANCGGTIEIINMGFIDFNPEMEWKLRAFVGCPVLPSATTDKAVWRIDGDQGMLKDELTCS